MPDWSYRTVLRPVLFGLPPRLARGFCLNFLARLSRIPGGGRMIDFLGHMRPDPRLGLNAFGRRFLGPVGLSCAVDAPGVATRAFARFGFSAIEVGPVGLKSSDDVHSVRMVGRDAFALASDRRVSVEQTCRHSRDWLCIGVPIFVRLHGPHEAAPEELSFEYREILQRIGSRAAGFILPSLDVAANSRWTDEQWRVHVAEVADAITRHAADAALLLLVRADADIEVALPLLRVALRDCVSGILVDGCMRTSEGDLYGAQVHERARATVLQLRATLGPSVTIIQVAASTIRGMRSLCEPLAPTLYLSTVASSSPGLAFPSGSTRPFSFSRSRRSHRVVSGSRYLLLSRLGSGRYSWA